MDAIYQAKFPHVRGAAVSESVFAVSNAIIIPSSCLLNAELTALSIDDARVTGAPKGIINARIYKDWLEIFLIVLEAHVIQNPVILTSILLSRM